MGTQKTSCIPEPANDPLIIIKNWQVVFCQGNRCAAGLLSFFIYWYNIKIQIAKKNKKLNDIAEVHGDPRAHEENRLQFHSMDDLIAGLLGLFGKTAINAAIKLLLSLHVLSIHRNPNTRYKFDRTRYFLLHPAILIKWLENDYRGYHFVDTTHSAETTDRESDFGLSKKSIETTSFDSNPKPLPFQDNSEQNSRNVVAATHSPETANRESENGQSIQSNPADRVTAFSQSSAVNGQPITEISPEIKKAAASKTERVTVTRTSNPEGEVQSTSKPQNAAAAFFDDAVIVQELTPNQQQSISTFVTIHSDSLKIFGSHQALCQAISADILNQSCFTKAGQDFSKKLNTIKKLIREGQWFPLRVMEKASEAEDKRNATIKSLKAEIKTAELQRQTWLNALSDPFAKNCPDSYRASCQKELNSSESQIKTLYCQLRELSTGKESLSQNEKRINEVSQYKNKRETSDEQLFC